MPADDFPKLYEEKGEEIVSIKKKDIEEYISRVAFPQRLIAHVPLYQEY